MAAHHELIPSTNRRPSESVRVAPWAESTIDQLGVLELHARRRLTVVENHFESGTVELRREAFGAFARGLVLVRDDEVDVGR